MTNDDDAKSTPVPNVTQTAVSGIDREPLTPAEPSTLAGSPGYRVTDAEADDYNGGQTADEGDEEVLRGAALDDALEAKGLSKSGTADEKRERLAAAGD
jgi:hypothetical protein